MPTHTQHPTQHPRRRSLLRALLAGLAALAATTGLLATTSAPASAGQVGVTVGIRGAGSVTVVEGSIEDGAQLTCQRHDNQDQRVTAWCPRMRNSEAFEAWVWLRATPAFQPADQWVFRRWTGCDQTRERNGFQECAVHSGAFSSDEKYPVAEFLDVVAPEVSGPIAGPVAGQDRTFSFLFSASDGVTSCRVVGVVEWFRCANGHPVQVPEGAHSFQVRATDPSGNEGLETVGVVAVDTRIASGSPSRTNDPTPSFDLRTGAGKGFWCSLDGGDWAACGTGTAATYETPALADGAHRLLVQARSGTWLDSVPAEWRWVSDTVGPTTTIRAVTAGNTAEVTLTSADAVRYECRLDRPTGPGAWAECASGMRFTGLADGEHSLSVRGIDDVGNVESPAKVHRWTVRTSPAPDPGQDPGQDPTQDPAPVQLPGDTTPPETTVISGPAGFVAAPSATFGFTSEAGAGFRCTLDGAPVTCGSALALNGLRSGTHALAVAAVDAAGNVDPTPAVRTWTVPATAAELRPGRGWRLERSAKAYGGSHLESSRRGAALTRRVQGAREVALVVGKGRRHGTVKVYAGSRLVGTVRLAATRSTTRQVVPVTRFATPYTGRLRVVIATQGRPVRIEGLGVATG
ncbi:hypothetical protein [Nocardioides xinjiangensis]|uniref:hypothetical protein n=1 Tax=Nocardioides xinjiangensis TaxID=2817376 RepID=UPI001B30379F|nr:hypothetical protein [Nocardioides sp. SYSU D00514]